MATVLKPSAFYMRDHAASTSLLVIAAYETVHIIMHSTKLAKILRIMFITPYLLYFAANSCNFSSLSSVAGWVLNQLVIPDFVP